MSRQAVCPCCGQTTSTYAYERRRFYVFHTTSGRRRNLLGDEVECEATGWLVEDEELVGYRLPTRRSGIRGERS